MSVRLGDTSLLTQALNGSPNFLGTIVATTTKNNNDTATPFSNSGELLKGIVLLVQPDAACYILPGATSTTTVTTTNGLRLDANEKFYLTMQSGNGYLACVSVSGTTTNLKVWQLV